MVLGMNAYIWWYLRQPDCNLINSNGSLKKKGYTMAQFSKFIRPGFRRIEANYNPQPGLYIAAFTGDARVITSVYRNSMPTEQVFSLVNDTIIRVAKYVTDQDKNLSYEGTIEVTDGLFSSSFNPKSITTFISTNSDACPQTQFSPVWKIGDGVWQSGNEITIIAGSELFLSLDGGEDKTYFWSGCGQNGTTSEFVISPVNPCQVSCICTNSCGAETVVIFNIEVESNTNSSKIYERSSCSVFPNPTSSGVFTIGFDKPVSDLIKVEIYQINGEKVYERIFSGKSAIFDNQLVAGLYILRIIQKNDTLTKKLLVE